MNLWQKGKRRMLHSVRIRSMKDTSLRLGTPVFLVLMGLVVCLLWGIWENRKLADKYIADTAKLYVDQINRDMSQINSELIYLLDSDSNIKEIPDHRSRWLRSIRNGKISCIRHRNRWDMIRIPLDPAQIFKNKS